MAPARAQIRARLDNHRPGPQAGETEDTVPAELTPDPTHEHRAARARDRRPSTDVDQAPQAPSTGPSIAPSTATSPAGRVSAGQPRKSRSIDAFDNPPRSTQVWKPTGVRRQEVLKALGIFQRATADQLWRMLRPADRHDRITRDTLNALKGSGLVRVETRLESGHQLWVLTEKGHKEAKLLLPKTVRISALRKPEYDDEGRPVQADGYDEHAAAVTSTAAVLTGAGYGTPLSWQTEIAHRLPYGYTQYADLTMRAPDAGVPAMLLEVDRVTEPVDDLVAKLRRYTDWFELLAPKADANKEKAARRQGAAVHDFRLWSRIYPATGREGYVPVAFVFTGRTAAQRASRIERLEQAARAYFAGTPHRGESYTAVDYHQAVPVVVTELERITADPAGAAGKVWRRLGRDEWQTLSEALDNPDGDRLYAVQLREARRRQAEREAAHREAQRPVCTRCGNKFTDDRWQETTRSSWSGERNRLCGPCAKEAADRAEAERVARRQAEEAERAAAEAPAVKPRSRFGIGRRR
ncbi:replication-relaxation family protein [Streptomyces sp. TRM 70361]|uniref:replication-relaxation family protein n=1 Tax=Streptomyces sp. TRM 70361 TaxID=3116553 RepID=UPI002E7B7B4B|nr:replication-relaxation family protein [Streptomyces sp. TRM 70361]MEE1943268.1 replication-relaxation family protein [Streptomyces sp. TRM 70361]